MNGRIVLRVLLALIVIALEALRPNVEEVQITVDVPVKQHDAACKRLHDLTFLGLINLTRFEALPDCVSEARFRLSVGG